MAFMENPTVQSWKDMRVRFQSFHLSNPAAMQGSTDLFTPADVP